MRKSRRPGTRDLRQGKSNGSGLAPPALPYANPPSLAAPRPTGLPGVPPGTAPAATVPARTVPANATEPASTAEGRRYHHISSAVVSALPGMAEEVAAQLSAMADVEVHAREGGKIVVTIEGASTGAMGDHLTRIALLDGVVAANLVFEHIEEV